MSGSVLVEVIAAQGSTPREVGAWMRVGPTAQEGTIGGGRLEFDAVDAARAMLADGARERRLEVPLGPEIGQCCGGRVTLRLRATDDAPAARAPVPRILLFGAGHVGRALAAALAPLPVDALLLDGRPGELALTDAPRRLTALPEAEVDAAPPGAAYVIATHDHGLDFLIAAQALARGDAAYVGLIGSATKRARFARFARARGVDPAPLVCPIGAAGKGDKRPAVIAAHVAAELLLAVTAR